MEPLSVIKTLGDDDVTVDETDIKKDFCKFFISESNAYDFNEIKEAFVARLMKLDETALQKLLDEAIEENQVIKGYNRKQELYIKQLKRLMKHEAKLNDCTKRKEKQLVNWEEKFNNLVLNTTSKLAALNEEMEDRNRWLDTEEAILQQHIIALREIKKKMLLLVHEQLCAQKPKNPEFLEELEKIFAKGGMIN